MLRAYQAIWDTGATASSITQKVVDELGLKPISMANVNTANGPTIAEVYVLDFCLPNGVVFKSVTATKGKITGPDVLIGMDIIGAGDFAVTSENGKTVFSYRLPSIECIDFVKHQIALNKSRFNPGGRNYPCGCGSKKPYKDCHGKP